MSTSGSADDIAAIVTRLSKELESVGLSALAGHQDDDGFDVIGLINASYDLIGLLRHLQHSKRQREDHAQQLLHDLQRSQWLLDKEKEVSLQREREAAEACEKERQAVVRLQLVETLLKKKTDEHRQLVHECQLKEKQWLHTLRRRDQDNHRLHQQLLKFLQSKSSGGTGFIPAELEIQGSLAPRMAGSVPRRLSETPSRRKQWDRSPDDSRKMIEVKWQTALDSLQKEHQLLRDDYLQLVDTVGCFLLNCATKLPDTRSTNLLTNVKEWIQLPAAMMKQRLDQVFRLVEDNLSILPNRTVEVEPKDQQVVVVLPKNSSSSGTGAAVVEQLESSVPEENRAVGDWLNRMTKGNNHCATPQQPSGITTGKRQATGTMKSIHSEKSTTPPSVVIDTDVFHQPTKGTRPTHYVSNPGVDWNQQVEVKDLPFIPSHYLSQDAVAYTTESAASFLLNENPNLDTPCPSQCNSRRGSSSSSSSSSSWKSQREAFDGHPRTLKTTACVGKGASMTAKVYFVQQNASPTTVLSENLVDVHLDVRSLTDT